MRIEEYTAQELFELLNELDKNLKLPLQARNNAGITGHFSAIGNHFLLESPNLLHVQCSRDYLAYKRIPKTQSCRFERKTSGLKIARSEKDEPIIEKTTPEFKEKRDMLLAAAKHGAVLISPYQTAEKRMTRFDACALNRIAQLIAGDGAADINYHGMKPTDIDRLVSEAVKGGFDGQHGDFWFSTEKSVTFRRVACKQSRDNFNKSENKGTEQ